MISLNDNLESLFHIYVFSLDVTRKWTGDFSYNRTLVTNSKSEKSFG